MIEDKRKEYHELWSGVDFNEYYTQYSAPMDTLDDLLTKLNQE